MIEKKITKVKATAKAVAFTGHREISHNHQEQVRERLKEAVLQAIRQGANKFYCGMALGFDMMAAEEVLSPQVEHPHAETGSSRSLQGTERFLVHGGAATLCLYPFQGRRCGASE